MEFTLDGRTVGPEPGKPYSERFIHGGILEERADVMYVVHNHSPNIVPFTVVKQCFCAIMHMAAPVGRDVCWDIMTSSAPSARHQHGHGTRPREIAWSAHGRMMRSHGCVVVGKSLRGRYSPRSIRISAQMLGKALAQRSHVSATAKSPPAAKAARASRSNAAGKTGAGGSSVRITRWRGRWAQAFP